MNDRDLVCVAMTPNSAQAHVWQSALEAEGIECQVGDKLNYWIDNTPWTQADVWVHRTNGGVELNPAPSSHDGKEGRTVAPRPPGVGLGETRRPARSVDRAGLLEVAATGFEPVTSRL